MSMNRAQFLLSGLEPDNLLAFLALLGLLRCLEAEGDVGNTTRPRVSWVVGRGPIRPLLSVRPGLTQQDVIQKAADGLTRLAAEHDFNGRKDIDYTHGEARTLLRQTALSSKARKRARADLLAALMTDAALKERNSKGHPTVDPTPLCLLFGQGHQHFLERLASVPVGSSPDSLTSSLEEALFAPWGRQDSTPSFRWDPAEGARYALLAGDPTDNAYKVRVQHGANRLAAVGLAVITVSPTSAGGRVRSSVIGGRRDRHGFAFAWPINVAPATLSTLRALLAHPKLWQPQGLVHLDVACVYVARRISVGKFMNFESGRILAGGGPPIGVAVRQHH